MVRRSAIPVVILSLSLLAVASARAQTTSVLYSGLNGPRGLAVGPDGNVYVAEAGTGGPTSTVGQCEQTPPPVGPYTGGNTARISMITPAGVRTTVVEGLPSAQNAFGDVVGVAALAFVRDTLYALVTGGGCGHGNPDAASGIYRIDRDAHTYELVADLGAFAHENPVAQPEPGDFEPEGSWYSMIYAFGQLYAVEANQGRIVKVNPGGQVRQILDVSEDNGHIVPTAIAARGNSFYVGNLNTFPIQPGSSQIMQLAVSGHFRGTMFGLTTVVGLAFDASGQLYALELSDAPGFPTPGAGKIVRVNSDGSIDDVVTGLVVPTAMTFGPDGTLYVSNFGAAPAGTGQILEITLP